ncbi:MAG: malate dehydrogenase [Desulfitibacter sp. BRH_c19]|nr:MAG: malate dehydrogenase [Desulfitibacter sp. BRH_c19]
MTIQEEALKLHEEAKGKLSIVSKVPVNNQKDLSLAYTPGVAEPCKRIAENPEESYKYTSRGNMVAVITDGTAVLGLGDIGPLAAMPVMEGKSVLFKEFAGVDAIPICLDTKDPEKIIETVKLIAPSFGGINLEDIAAPACFIIEERLKAELDIPVFHDDQHGTAVVVMAALLNSLKVVKKEIADIKIVVLGAGSAGIAIVKLLLGLGLKNVIMCDRKGSIYKGRDSLNPAKEEIANVTNLEKYQGDLEGALVNSDVFIGVSGPGLVSKDMIAKMAKDSIIMAMSNPVPEIMPDLAKEVGAKVICTGRSDFPNQVNNVLAFPGIFRGALDVRASDINEDMKLAAAYAIAGLITDAELKPEYVIPEAFDERVARAVANAVSEAAKKSGLARI